ncbi:MAG: amino acid permease [Candidatus Caenarcaniphilales bacterium]|nr:amino acid permease [Candidatus Caenarcaniphilales bacterium]
MTEKSTQSGQVALKRVLGPFDLIMMGVGCIIGVGIYILSGVAAANYAGPAVVLSFILAGSLCGFVALAYGELASMFPLAGSAYSYSYYAFGKRVAWFLGWTLLLEYTVAASAVAAGWSSYFQRFLKTAFNYDWPAQIGATPGSLPEGQWSINLPSVIILMVIAYISVRGMKESAIVNNVIAALKVMVLLFFIGFGMLFINPENWHPFVPERIATTHLSAVGVWEIPVLDFIRSIFSPGGIQQLIEAQSQFWHFGVQGVLTGSAIVFFTYVGFDMVSATAEETKNPQKDVPIGIIGSLLIATVLYIAVALVLTGIMPPVVDGLPNPQLTAKDAAAPLAIAFSSIKGIGNSASLIVSIGALAGVTTTLLALSLGLSRILLAISRDKFLPPVFSKVHSKFQTPYLSTLISIALVAIIAACLPIGKLAELCNLGTLAAFVFVCLSVIILRKKHPEFKRSFLCPAVPTVPIIGIVFCLVLMLSLPLLTWLWFGAWLVIGAVIYVAYGRSRASTFPCKEALKQAIAEHEREMALNHPPSISAT